MSQTRLSWDKACEHCIYREFHAHTLVPLTFLTNQPPGSNLGQIWYIWARCLIGEQGSDLTKFDQLHSDLVNVTFAIPPANIHQFLGFGLGYWPWVELLQLKLARSKVNFLVELTGWYIWPWYIIWLGSLVWSLQCASGKYSEFGALSCTGCPAGKYLTNRTGVTEGGSCTNVSVYV
jgi:hypothetical protein